MSKVIPADKTIDSHIVLKISDPDSPFFNIQYYYEGMKFADEENEDGSMNMSFDYQVIEGEIPSDKIKEFEKFIGDQLLILLEEQIAREQVIYKGGSGEAEIISE